MALTADERLEMASLEDQISGYMKKDWLSPSEREAYDSLASRLGDLQRRDSPSDPTQMALPPTNNVAPSLPDGFPPAPNLGVPVVPASNETSNIAEPDPSIPVSQAPPVEGHTKYLPLTGNDTYDTTIKQVDAALDKINDAAFKLNPQDLWHHDGAQLGGPAGPSTISNLQPATDAMKGVTSDTADKFNAISGMWDKHGNQNAIARIRELYKPMMQAASEGVGEGGPAVESRNMLDQSGNGVRGVFDSFHGAIAASRDAIEGLYGYDENGNRYLDTSRTLNLDPSIVSDAQAKIVGLQESTDRLGKSLDSWNIPTRVSGDDQHAQTPPSDTSSPGTPNYGGGAVPGTNISSPHSTSPDAGIPPAGLPGGIPSAMPGGGMPGMPQMPGAPQMPGVPSIPDIPHETPPGTTELSADENVPKDGTSALHEGGGDHKPSAKPVTDQSSAAVHTANMAAIPRPGDPVRPGALGADGQPLDKDGDGKMDADALAATKENMDRNGDGMPDQFQITLDADGRSIDVAMNDPRLAEMMTRMASASEDSPLSVLDAAKESGLDLSDYGEKVDTLSIRPGDVVTGTATGFYAGNGLVLTEDGHLKGLQEVMDFDRSNPAVHRLALPELPSDSEVVPHVDPETLPQGSDTGQTPVPPEPAPVPHDTPAPTTNAPHAQPTPASAAPAPPPKAAPTSSSPSNTGLPEEVAFEGQALG